MSRFVLSKGNPAALETQVILSGAKAPVELYEKSFAVRTPPGSSEFFAALRMTGDWEQRHWTRARGFTLIELLVVIVIVTVLAALGNSAWQRVQRGSRAAACMQNLRQIGAGLAKYVGEHDGVFPTLEMARTSQTQDVPVLDTELRAYVPDARVFSCPDDRKRLAETTGTSYLWNHRLNGQRLGNLSVSFVKMDPIEDPGRIMVMGDKEGFHPNLENKLNVLYADGHASQQLTFVDDTAQK